MRITVTLDDVGRSPGVNAAAARLLAAGKADCISVMATGPELMDAVELASESGVRVAVHLNCVEPPFLTGNDFPASHETWFLRSRRLASPARDEWRLQIEKVLSCGLLVTGLDSHQHLHNAPGLRDVVLELAREYGISTVRAAVLPDRWRSLEALLLDRMGRRLASAARTAGLSAPDAMLGFTASGSVTREYLRGLEGSLAGGGTAELVMHPSVEPEWSLYQPMELELLESRWFEGWAGKGRE